MTPRLCPTDRTIGACDVSTATEVTDVASFVDKGAVPDTEQDIKPDRVFVRAVWVQVENLLLYLKFGIAVCFIAASGDESESEINGVFNLSSFTKMRGAIGRYV